METKVTSYFEKVLVTSLQVNTSKMLDQIIGQNIHLNSSITTFSNICFSLENTFTSLHRDG